MFWLIMAIWSRMEADISNSDCMPELGCGEWPEGFSHE
jgi:hypothetical protein